MKKLLILLTIIVLLNPCVANAQKDTHDTTYYTSYPGSLTARVYFTQKYASLKFPAQDNAKDLRYNANGKLGFGIGATYHNLTLNLAYGFSFLNNNQEERGKTKGIDFQLHLSPYKWAADAILTAYKSSYVSPKGYGAPGGLNYYVRPDVDITFAGVSLYRVPNADKFSYRAALVQNEWQKKSAGSLLYGGEIYYGVVKGDSSLVPVSIASHFPQAGINNIHFITIGPGIGYAYTVVAAKHFFLMGSLVGNLDINFATEEKDGNSQNKTSVDPVAIYKASAGYNSNTWSISAIVAGNSLLFEGNSYNKPYYLSTGNFKLFFAKKIMLKKH